MSVWFFPPSSLFPQVPKLLLIKLSTNTVTQVYLFPDAVTSYTGSFLNDIVRKKNNERKIMKMC